jgi:hypothetical protein
MHGRISNAPIKKNEERDAWPVGATLKKYTEQIGHIN